MAEMPESPLFPITSFVIYFSELLYTHGLSWSTIDEPAALHMLQEMAHFDLFTFTIVTVYFLYFTFYYRYTPRWRAVRGAYDKSTGYGVEATDDFPVDTSNTAPAKAPATAQCQFAALAVPLFQISALVFYIMKLLRLYGHSFRKISHSVILDTFESITNQEMLSLMILTEYLLYPLCQKPTFWPGVGETRSIVALLLVFLISIFPSCIWLANASDDFPNPSSITALAVATATPAPAQILQLNTACLTISSLLSACTAATIQFTALVPTQQASCLCYEATTFYKPNLFDGAVKICADYASVAVPIAYPPIAGLINFCAVAGPGAMPTGIGTEFRSTVSTETEKPCGLVSAYLGSCQKATPGFLTMSSMDQASCLCYTSGSWAPTSFDNLVSSCEGSAKDQDPVVWSAIVSLSKFCGEIGSARLSSNLESPRSTAAGVLTSLSTNRQLSTTSTDVTVSIMLGSSQSTIGGIIPVGTNGSVKVVRRGEVVGISAVCAAALIFLY